MKIFFPALLLSFLFQIAFGQWTQTNGPLGEHVMRMVQTNGYVYVDYRVKGFYRNAESDHFRLFQIFHEPRSYTPNEGLVSRASNKAHRSTNSLEVVP